jgi:hypothetical protein
MKARVIGIVVTLIVVGLLTWLSSHLSFQNMQVPVPLRGEAARNPFYAAIRLSDLLGAQATWERVFTAPPADGVILVSSWNWTLSRTRGERLQRWVEGGGRLIVDDSVMVDLEAFESWTGIHQHEIEEIEAHTDADEEETDDEEAEVEESSSGERVTFTNRFFKADCHALTEDGSSRKLEVCDVNRTQSLSSEQQILWALRDKDGIHALRTAVGRGSVTVINATPFRYRDFLLGDHPLLFVTAAQLRRGDIVTFLTEEDHASLLRLMWRFGAPALLLLLAGVGLALWRASPRFGPRTAPTESARRSLADQIRGTGQFALRFGAGAALHAAALRALRDAAIHRFPGYDHMSATERVAALGKFGGLDPGALGPAMETSGTRNSHELRDAIAILESTRRRLLSRRSIHGTD